MYKSKKQNNKEKGITLIALIITIIILLILAGVTINLTLGDNGLFNTAKRAVSNYTNAAEQELDYFNQINDTIEETMQGELTISIDSINSKGFKINVTNTKSIKNDDVIFEYYLDDKKVETTQQKYYVINNIDWEQEHTVYVKEFYNNKYKCTSKKYHLKSEGIPRLTSNTSSIITEGDWRNGMNPERYVYQAFDGDEQTLACPLESGAWGIGYSIGYDFGEPVLVYEASGKIRMLGYKIQASNDNKNWEDIVTVSSPGSDYGDNFVNQIINGKKYRYWRLYINDGQQNAEWSSMVYELQFNYIIISIGN